MELCLPVLCEQNWLPEIFLVDGKKAVLTLKAYYCLEPNYQETLM